MSDKITPDTDAKSKKSIWVPDTLVIIFAVVVCAWIASFLITPGVFSTKEVSYQLAEKTVTKTVLDSESFRYVQSENSGSPLFAAGGSSSLLTFAFDGLTSGSKFGAAIGVVAFLLIIGGAFGVLLSTNTIDIALKGMISKLRGRHSLIIPILCLVFSLGGAIFGMGEEAIAFAMILTPIIIRLGYDGLTAIMCTYVATQIGFASSWMNPFNVAVAQGLAGIPIYSGSGLRIILWSVFTTSLIVYLFRYTKKIKRDPKTSLSFESDRHFREQNEIGTHKNTKLQIGHWLILATLLSTLVWIIWGVVQHGYYIPEIATQFFTMGLVCGVIACLFSINDFSINKIAESFREGAGQMLAPALVVGLSQGVLIVLGGTDPETPSALNTILHVVGGAFSEFSTTVAALGMLSFQATLNFFVTSGSGQAALTMPLMAPLADLVGVTRQTAILAFQLGDGLTNILVPTSAPLMGTLGVVRIEWAQWARYILGFMILNFVLAAAFVALAVAINY